MQANDFILDEDLWVGPLVIPEEKEGVVIAMPDWLETEVEVYSDQYINKIIDFVNSSSLWYESALNSVKQYGVDRYEQFDCECRLLIIHVLFEQDDPIPIYGLEFRVNFDIEHGCGLKMEGVCFGVFDVGLAENAYTV